MEKSQVKIVVLSLNIYFAIAMLTRFISQIFVLNFSTSGLNGSILLVVVFLSGIVYILLQKMGTLSHRLELPVVLVICFLNFMTLLPSAVFSSLISGVNLGFVLYLIMRSSGSEEFRYAFGLAIFYSLTFSVLFFGLNLYATIWGKMNFGILTLIYGLIFYTRRNDDKIWEYRSNNSAFYTFLALIIYTSLFVGYPYVVSAWNNEAKVSLAALFGLKINHISSLFSILMAIMGLAAVYASLFTQVEIDQRFSIIIFLGSLVCLVFFFVLPLIMYAFNLASMIQLLPKVEYHGDDKIEIKLIYLQFILLILMFLQVTSGHWAFLPSVAHPILHGMSGIYLFAIAGTASSIVAKGRY